MIGAPVMKFRVAFTGRCIVRTRVLHVHSLLG
jgi:hypothetical protein